MSRRYPDDIPPDEINKAMDEIERVFTSDWLTDSSDENSLKILWGRKDVVSTLELFSFGQALIKMNKINQKWVKGQVNHIKGKDENNRRGAFFEIIGLGMLANDSYNIIPAPNSQPGFDASINSSNFPEARLSLKSFGRSDHDRKFEELGNRLEKKILLEMRYKRLYYAEFYIKYLGANSPEETEWEELISNIHKHIKAFKHSNMKPNGPHIPHNGRINNWDVSIRQTSRKSELHPRKISHFILITAPFHNNEFRNLYSKLKQAQINFKKHVRAGLTTNILFIHLPLTISVHQCEIWTKQYFEDNTDMTVQTVIYYQCALAHNSEEGINALNHTLYFVQNPYQPVPKPPLFIITPSVGYVSLDSTQLQLTTDGLVSPDVSLDNNYIFQRARFYNKAVEVEPGAFEGRVYSPAPGIHNESVIDLGNGKIGILSGEFEPTDELLIL